MYTFYVRIYIWNASCWKALIPLSYIVITSITKDFIKSCIFLITSCKLLCLGKPENGSPVNVQNSKNAPERSVKSKKSKLYVLSN